MKRYLSIILSICMLIPVLNIPAYADGEVKTTTITPQMTYVNYDQPNEAFGYIAAGSTAESGYNNLKNNTIGMGNTSYGVNFLTYLKVDASAVTDKTIISAVLKMEVSGSADTKRTCTYGAVAIPYTDWDNTLTYNKAVANGMLSGTPVGESVGTSSKSATGFETKTIDITDALKDKAVGNRIITIAIYETSAGGGYIKNPSVEVKHTNLDGYTVTYSVNGVESSETIFYGYTPANVPKAENLAHEDEKFVGWKKDGDGSTMYSSADIAEMAGGTDITADTTFTAVYEEDEDYKETILESEFFEDSKGGFTAVANMSITTDKAAAEGMYGNVLTFTPAKSADSAYTTYYKLFDSTVTSKQFAALQFDIAAKYRDGQDRNIDFGAYDEYNHQLFALTLKDKSAASLKVNDSTELDVTGMTPSEEGTSYRVKAEFNFFTNEQHITIAPTADTDNIIFDKTYDIVNAENLAKVGMPVGMNYKYGAIQLDNFYVKVPALRKVSFNIKDNSDNAVNGAVVTIYGADGRTMEVTSENGIAAAELPDGGYTYTVNGHPGGCTSIAAPVSVTVSGDDVTENVSLIKFNGPTANEIVLTADSDAATVTAGKEAQTITYTAVIKDQDGNAMNDEKVVWTVTGTDSYATSGDNSGSTCAVTIPAGAPRTNISVTAASKTFDFLTQTKTLKVIGYPAKLAFKTAPASIQIPDEGSIAKEYTAVVKDSSNNTLKGGVTYAIENAPSGVSVDSATGVITVLSTASEAVFTLKASSKDAAEIYAEKEITLTHDAPSGLMADLREEPAGISKTPKFSWIMNSSGKNRTQTAYRILVSSTLEKLNNDEGDLWDSGKVSSDKSTSIAYAGSALSGSSGYYWKVKTWDNDGSESPWSMPQRFFTAADSWVADAIWTDSSSANVIFARKSFTVNKTVENALLNITASSNAQTRQFTYRAYINGEYVGLGPQFKTYNNQYFYNSFDVTDHITSGENVLGAICYALSDKKLMAELKITYTDGTSDIIKTDSTWKVLDGTYAYGDNGTSAGTNYYTAMAENINANYYPYGWDMTGYDDTEWAAPKTKTAINNLAPAAVDPVGEYDVSPNEIVEKSKGNYFIDLGKEITGGIYLEFSDIENPTELEMRYGEELSSANTVKYEMRTGNVYREYFTMKEGDQTFKNLGMKSFRYIEILNSPVEITKDNIKGIAIRQEFNDDESYFRSDNDLLNAVYDLCKYSIKATTQDMLVDSQTRERGPYEGDLYVNQLSMYSFMRNYSVPRFTNESLAFGPTWPEEYHQMTILSAWQDYMYTGDTASLEKLYTTLKGKLLEDTKFSNTYNLYQSGKMGSGGTGQILIDWPNSQRDGYETEETDYNTVVNAFHYAAASALSEIAGVLGKTDDAERYSELAEKIKTGMEKLYVGSENRYSDGMKADGTLRTHYAQHASFFPLALGAVDDEEQMSDIAKEIGADGNISCSIYATQFLLTAMYNAGDAEDALKMLTSTADKKSWYHVMNNLGATIVPECWDPSQKGNMTLSHAWGSSPANIIVRNLCGITPTEPGYTKMQIKPQLGGLKNIEVKTPNIKGYVYMSIDAENKTMSVNIPANTTAAVYVPFNNDDGKTLYMDGAQTSAEIDGEYYVLDSVGSGKHTFTVGSKIENKIEYTAEGSVMKSVTISANCPADLYVTVYGEGNALTNVHKYDVSVGEEQKIETNIDIPESGSVRIYMWKNDTMQPIYDAVDVEK